MRDRFTEWLPLLLAGVLLIAFQFARSGGLNLSVAPLIDTSSASLPAAGPTTGPQLASEALRATPLPATSQCRLRFVNSLAMLRNALGATMGDPLECEHPVDGAGNTQQRTTTGLAYYRKAINAGCFTTGWDHWALIDQGRLVHWTGDAVDPPADATPVNR
jgi:hypothetical protein